MKHVYTIIAAIVLGFAAATLASFWPRGAVFFYTLGGNINGVILCRLGIFGRTTNATD